jgi:hypothetical protein
MYKTLVILDKTVSHKQFTMLQVTISETCPSLPWFYLLIFLVYLPENQIIMLITIFGDSSHYLQLICLDTSSKHCLAYAQV